MKHSACFIGHREVDDTAQLRERLERVLVKLIRTGTVNFIFGDHSDFDRLCYETVTVLKEQYPAIRRINFRKNYEDTDSYTMSFLTCGFEESICPQGVGKAGRASYVESNRAMIRESETCVFYYDEAYLPAGRKNSGTALAFHYAKSQKKEIANIFCPADRK